MPEKMQPNPDEAARWGAAEEATNKALREQWRLFSVEERLGQLGVTKETIGALGIDGIVGLLTDADAEEVRALTASRDELQKTLSELLADPEIKALVAFRAEQLQKAYAKNDEIKSAEELEREKFEERLGGHSKETRKAEYEVKLGETRARIKELEEKEKEGLSADETNELKSARAKAAIFEMQIKEIGRTKKDLTLEERKLIEESRNKLDGLEEERQELLKSSPEAFLGLHDAEFRAYTEGLAEGRMVETPFVKEHLDEAESHLRAGIPVMIYGHLGSGKTELAMYLAKTRFKKSKEQEKRKVPDFYMISGSKHIVPSEFYGHQTLTIPGLDEIEGKKMSQDQVRRWEAQVAQVEGKFQKWEKENSKKTEEEKSRYHQALLELYCAQLGKGTISDYVLGPVYEAMKEGRPLIIDEVNAIPHEVLISLNYILTRKAGDEITVQQDTGMKIKIKEGFCIMMTGNLDQGQAQYADRQVMDPAFLSRLHRMEYSYLPQKKEGTLEDERGPDNELFQLILAKLADKEGNVTVPEGSLPALWRLAEAARLIQDVFAGRETNSAYYFREAGGKATKYILKKSTLSLRDLGHILDAWKGDNFRMELDHYLYKDFVGQAVDLNDRAYLYQTMKDQFGFFRTGGWEQNPNYGTGGQVASFDVKTPKNKAGGLEFLGPKEIIEAAFGKVPERTEWPEMKINKSEEEIDEGNYFRKRKDFTENRRAKRCSSERSGRGPAGGIDNNFRKHCSGEE